MAIDEGIQGIDDQEKLKRKVCFACKQEVDVTEGHHLTYEPEAIVQLCRRCHYLLHGMARAVLRKKGVLTIFVDWINQYSHQWINGKSKYEVSQYKLQKQKERDASLETKTRKREYQQSEKCIQRRKKYREVNRDLVKAQRKAFYCAHREELLAARRTEEYREYHRELWQRDIGRNRQRQNDWKHSNPEKVRCYDETQRARRRLLNNAT